MRNNLRKLFIPAAAARCWRRSRGAAGRRPPRPPRRRRRLRRRRIGRGFSAAPRRRLGQGSRRSWDESGAVTVTLEETYKITGRRLRFQRYA
jgi:hypothetical protein